MANFTSVLDASILYSAAARDLILSLAANGLYRPAWSELIHDEWMRNLIANQGGGARIRAYASRTRQRMDAIFPDALIDGFQPLIASLTLPDAKDRHVLAAAIHVGAAAIVTYNLPDFPASELDGFGIEAWHPDGFVEFLFNYEMDAAAGRSPRASSPAPTPSENPKRIRPYANAQAANVSNRTDPTAARRTLLATLHRLAVLEHGKKGSGEVANSEK